MQSVENNIIYSELLAAMEASQLQCELVRLLRLKSSLRIEMSRNKDRYSNVT